MNNNDFFYFFYETKLKDLSEIYNVFNNGLISNQGPNINKVFNEADISYNQLDKKIKEFSSETESNVFVIKIPKFFFNPIIINNQLQQMPLPIWKQITEDNNQEKYLITSKFVYGIYLMDRKSFVFNTEYSPVHDPTGLQYDDRQIKYLEDNNLISTSEFAKSRRAHSFEELVEIDNDNNNWNNILTRYKRHFNL